jgi:hypothetical protein
LFGESNAEPTSLAYFGGADRFARPFEICRWWVESL